MIKPAGRFTLILLIGSAFALSGCSTFRGAPQPLITDATIASSAEAAEGQLKILSSGCPQDEDRNATMLKVLAFVDLRYMNFRNDIVANSKHSGAVASGITLAADVAASLTTSRGVKDNYIALSQLVQGGETIFNKEYLYQRTLDALVSQMDASRRAKLVEIRTSMNLAPSAYPCEAAVADILDYYYAGTINGAIVDVQKTAVEDNAKSTDDLKKAMRAPSQADIDRVRSESDRIGVFLENLKAASDLARLQGYLAGRGVAVASNASDSAFRIALRQGINELVLSSYDDDFDKFVADMKIAGFDIPK